MGFYTYAFIGAATIVGAFSMIHLKLRLEQREWRNRAIRKKDKIKL